jgi:hypothetical protein
MEIIYVVCTFRISEGVHHHISKWSKLIYSSYISTLNKKILTSHTDTKLMDMSDRYRLRDDNSPDMEKGMHWSIYKEAVVVLQWSYIPLLDNHNGASIVYYVAVETSVTSSKVMTSSVYVQLIGKNGSSGTRKLLISCYHSLAPISDHRLISTWHFRCLCMAILTLLLINMW